MLTKVTHAVILAVVTIIILHLIANIAQLNPAELIASAALGMSCGILLSK